jgi:ZIP family zinc transporter
MLTEEENYALLLSTLAGLSTSVGGVLAVWKRPDAKLLAFLLGTAIGVMATLSFVELYVKNVLENGFWGITLSTMAGAVLYAVVEPLLPHVDLFEKDGPGGTKQKQNGGGSGSGSGGKVKSSELNMSSSFSKSMSSSMSSAMNERGVSVPGETEASRGRLMRLGILMAVAMTLHNIPEGFAVAFSSFTEIGPIMAIAIGLHNVPEGIIVAAPVFAATGSRRKALALATASGLSEPLGALFALFFIQPYLTPLRLQYMLAATGGVMSAVCFIELWPEGKKCKNDVSLAKGVILGSALMLGTLYVGV